jgi:hypothetical protein
METNICSLRVRTGKEQSIQTLIKELREKVTSELERAKHEKLQLRSQLMI